MNKNSSDNSVELNKGDVIYINKDKRPVRKSEPIQDSEPKSPPRAKVPSFTIPLDEKRRPTPPKIEEIKPPKPPSPPIAKPPIKSSEPPNPPSPPLTAPTAPPNPPTGNPRTLDSFSPGSHIESLPIQSSQTVQPQAVQNPTSPPELPSVPANLNLDANHQASSLPLPPAPLPPALNPRQPMATTDLQGNLGSNPPLVMPKPAVTPDLLPSPPINTPAEPEEDEADQKAPVKGTKHLKAFGIITILIIVGTLILGFFFIWPKLQVVLESKQSSEVYEFENVLVNLLQVENQEMEIKLTDSQIQNIVPALENQNEITQAQITVNNVLKIEHSSDSSNPLVGSKFRFDLDLQTSESKRDNLILDVMAVFTDDEQAYFKLDSLSINNRAVDLEETSFADRWSDLDHLLLVQAGGDDAKLDENKSVFLNYIANLLNLYSYPHYLVLLPVFNITQSQHYHQAREILQQSQAYDLDSSSCKTLQNSEQRCWLKINYEHLYSLYEDIYDVLGQDMPAYYDILKVADSESSNLPATVEIVFDKDRNYPVSLSAIESTDEISASSLVVNYKSFDESSFDTPTFDDPLDLIEYHRQILEYEEEVSFDI